MPSQAGNFENQQSKLSAGETYELLENTRASGYEGAFNPAVATLEAIDRAEVARGYPPLSRRHIGVMLWLLENPTATLTEGAKVLGYSRPWLSHIVNSHPFQAYYRILLSKQANDIALKLLTKLK